MFFPALSIGMQYHKDRAFRSQSFRSFGSGTSSLTRAFPFFLYPDGSSVVKLKITHSN